MACDALRVAANDHSFGGQGARPVFGFVNQGAADPTTAVFPSDDESGDFNAEPRLDDVRGVGLKPGDHGIQLSGHDQ